MCSRKEQPMQIANYEYSQKIGQGAFGIVYKGKNRRTNEPVVVKTESYDVEYSSLKHESTILNILYSKSCRSIPPTYWYGVEPVTRQRILVMPFYDESLERYVSKRTQNGVNLDIRVAQNIMRSCISVLNHIHNRFVVHRDIKPANWMIRRDEIVLIDFGLATFYVDESETHITPTSQQKTHLIGTAKYVSWNVHCGEEYTRRDDLISMVYVGMFLLRGPIFLQQPQSSDASLNQPAMNEKSKTECAHPLNQFYKNQKTIDNIKRILAESWPALNKMAGATYGLAFQERPSYDDYIEWFSSHENYTSV